jgi:DNA polymerase-3 subunit delta'
MRPDAFASIREQDGAVDVLRRAVAGGRVAHAYAFVGPAGSGRKATALAFAKALAAPDDPARAARIDRGVCPDVQVIAPTPPDRNPKGADKNQKGPLALRIGDIRELERAAALRPVEAPWKVFIVDEAERMTGAAPQAFLKTLEEPPAHTVIVLILSQVRALPATVLSRCQIVRFQPPVTPGVPALLPDGRGEPYEAALSALAEARTGRADAILRVGEALGRDRAAAETLVEACWLHYRDLLCREAGADAGLLVFEPAPDAPSRGLDDVLRGLAACRDAWHALTGNVAPRLTVEVLLGRLALHGARA